MSIATLVITTINIATAIRMTKSHLSLLKLLQLSSPTLPVGAFAYSQGLESAIESGLVKDSQMLKTWLKDSLKLSLHSVDIPIFLRMYKAWDKTTNADSVVSEEVLKWNRMLRAQRETSELRA